MSSNRALCLLDIWICVVAKRKTGVFLCEALTYSSRIAFIVRKEDANMTQVISGATTCSVSCQLSMILSSSNRVQVAKLKYVSLCLWSQELAKQRVSHCNFRKKRKRSPPLEWVHLPSAVQVVINAKVAYLEWHKYIFPVRQIIEKKKKKKKLAIIEITCWGAVDVLIEPLETGRLDSYLSVQSHK